jgi:hypothetical protein
MPLSLAPEADEVLDRLTGCWSPAPQCFHSLVPLRMEGHWSTLVTSRNKPCLSAESRQDLTQDAVAALLDMARETIRGTLVPGKQHLRAVLDAHARAERGEPNLVGRVSPRPALH